MHVLPMRLLARKELPLRNRVHGKLKTDKQGPTKALLRPRHPALPRLGLPTNHSHWVYTATTCFPGAGAGKGRLGAQSCLTIDLGCVTIKPGNAGEYARAGEQTPTASACPKSIVFPWEHRRIPEVPRFEFSRGRPQRIWS